MDFIRRILGMNKSKPFKVQDIEGKRRVGVVASSLKELKEKGLLKLKIKTVSSIVLEEDGTEVEDEEYFKTLEPQAVVIFLQPGEIWEGYISYLKLAGNKIIENVPMRNDLIFKIKELLEDPESPELSLMFDYVHAIHADVDAEHIEDDPDWFDGVTKYKTKAKVMRHSAKSRIRGYLSKSKEYSNSVEMKNTTRKEINKIIDSFQNELKSCEYFGDYFDRTASEESLRLCDEKGWFNCQGAFDVESCDRMHKINPYLSKDARVLFSTWNLDHQVEKSRVILPKLREAIEKRPKNKKINWKYFFDLLFTLDNLKLVDIRCHKKEKHLTCVVDIKRIYTS